MGRITVKYFRNAAQPGHPEVLAQKVPEMVS
jgi:hypothetical protein